MASELVLGLGFQTNGMKEPTVKLERGLTLACSCNSEVETQTTNQILHESLSHSSLQKTKELGGTELECHKDDFIL